MTDNSIKVTDNDMKKYDVIQKLINKQITENEASKLIWVGNRQIRRIKKNVLENWIKWLINKNKGKISNRAISNDLKEKIISIIKEKYYDFKPTFAAEKLEENHDIKISKESLRKLMIENKLWKVKKRKSSKNTHVWRARKDNYWEMQQFDWSYHKWLEDRNWWEEICLLAAIDDATWNITKAKFDINEWTIAVCKFWKEYNKELWIPVSIYLDKYSTYKINHPNAVDNKDLMTQFQRASNQIWTQLITAHSPQAKWRIERLFWTLQDRLIKDMRINNICTIEEANEFLKGWIHEFNEKFSVVPNNQSDLHKPLTDEIKENLDQIYSIHKERKIYNDLTISYNWKIYLLDKEDKKIWIFKKEIVTVETHLNWEIKIFYKWKYLNFTEIEKRPKKAWYIPVDVDKRLIENRKINNKLNLKSPWRKFKYWKSDNSSYSEKELTRADKLKS